MPKSFAYAQKESPWNREGTTYNKNVSTSYDAVTYKFFSGTGKALLVNSFISSNAPKNAMRPPICKIRTTK